MPRMSEHEPHYLGRVRISPASDHVLQQAREIATNMHHPLGLSDVQFACLLNEELRECIQNRIGLDKGDEVFRAASEALNAPSTGSMERLLSMAKWIHGRGNVEPEDLYLASARLLAQSHTPRKHYKRAV